MAVEQALMEILSSQSLVLPIISTQLLEKVSLALVAKTSVGKDSVNYVLNKLAKQGAICIKRVTIGGEVGCEVISVESKVLLDIYKAFINDNYDITEEIRRKYKILCELLSDWIQISLIYYFNDIYKVSPVSLPSLKSIIL